MDEELAYGELLFAKKKGHGTIILLYVLILILLGLVLFYYFFGCAVVSGMSMEDTLSNDQRTLLLRNGYSVERGDIVTFDIADGDQSKTLIKRVIALEGDRILYVKTDYDRYIDMYILKSGSNHFEKAEESYVKEPVKNGEKFHDVKVMDEIDETEIESVDVTTGSAAAKNLLAYSTYVPADEFYFMGDNRNNSTDSRYYGTKDKDCIIGKVIDIIPKDSGMEKFIDFMFCLY